MGDMDGEDLYSDFGPPVGLAEEEELRAGASGSGGSGVEPMAAEGGAAPQPPLVNVDAAALDLYADLLDGGGEGGTLLKTQVAELSDRVQRQEAQIAALQQQVEALTEENGQLSERCAALTSNISCLFNTAKLELARKDEAIKELRERVSAIRARPPGPPRPSSAPAAGQQVQQAQQAELLQQPAEAQQQAVPGLEGSGRQASLERQRSGSASADERRHGAAPPHHPGKRGHLPPSRRPGSGSGRPDEPAERRREGGRREEAEQRHGTDGRHREERHADERGRDQRPAAERHAQERHGSGRPREERSRDERGRRHGSSERDGEERRRHAGGSGSSRDERRHGSSERDER